jgi:hypothetical protein
VLVPPGEHEVDRAAGVGLFVEAAGQVHEHAAVDGEVEVAARGDVLVRVDDGAVGELDLEHPHEPVGELHADEGSERLPIRLFVLADLSCDDVIADHAGSLRPRA